MIGISYEVLLLSESGESTLIVTTRNTTVASVMCTVPIQYSEQLSDGTIGCYFQKHPFLSGNLSANPNLKTCNLALFKGQFKVMRRRYNVQGAYLHPNHFKGEFF